MPSPDKIVDSQQLPVKEPAILQVSDVCELRSVDCQLLTDNCQLAFGRRWHVQ